MKPEQKTLGIGLFAVAVLDILGSIASRQLDFNYSLLSVVSFIIYGTICFLVTRIKDLKTGVIYGAILGFFDSTIGLKMSMFFDANTGDFSYDRITPAVWVVTVMFMTGLGALVGLISGGLSRIVKKKGTNAQ